jgi:superfamily II DNA/RNA helicase
MPAAAVHGEDGDPEKGHRRARGKALRDLDEGQVKVLLATEMLARGVDIKGATHVVNATMPADAAAYLHRAGRVGRVGGRAGVVVSLPQNEAQMAQLRAMADQLDIELEHKLPDNCEHLFTPLQLYKMWGGGKTKSVGSGTSRAPPPAPHDTPPPNDQTTQTEASSKVLVENADREVVTR